MRQIDRMLNVIFKYISMWSIAKTSMECNLKMHYQIGHYFIKLMLTLLEYIRTRIFNVGRDNALINCFSYIVVLITIMLSNPIQYILNKLFFKNKISFWEIETCHITLSKNKYQILRITLDPGFFLNYEYFFPIL